MCHDLAQRMTNFATKNIIATNKSLQYGKSYISNHHNWRSATEQ